MALNKKVSIGCSLIGGTGFGAKEFLRLATYHPEISLCEIVSRSETSLSPSSMHAELTSFYDTITFSNEITLQKLEGYQHKFIILALPSEESSLFIQKHISEIQNNKIHVIDLSGNFRLQNNQDRERWYNVPSTSIDPHTYALFTYGLPEIYKERISSARHIANPGCYATAAILALHPVTSHFSVNNIIIDGKSGSSGVGKKLSSTFHHPRLHADAFCYSPLAHRHEPEMKEHLIRSKSTSIAFTPHVIPVSRGMLVSCYASLDKSIQNEDLHTVFSEYYSKCPFIRLRDTPPHISDVAGSNFCDIHYTVRNSQIMVTACIDNLIKGMSGQAIQNINIICNLDDKTGLWHPGFGIV